ncbi:hypothetical protein [Erythrobacter sp. MTPC3]|uniref:hypothetical protein n=1 Tax=Erythrobacter sp. MTPC3 TaxID=3056564 RepID=UPI0036F22333
MTIPHPKNRAGPPPSKTVRPGIGSTMCLHHAYSRNQVKIEWILAETALQSFSGASETVLEKLSDGPAAF